MESKSLLLAVTIATVVAMPGCSSQRPRLAWWKPTSLWSSKDKAETTALARSAPELPSSKFEPMEPSSTAVASNTKPATPPEARDSIAAAPAANYQAPSSTDYVSPVSKTTESTAGAASPTVAAMAPQTSPYSNDNYVSPEAPATSIAGSLPPVQPQDRYAAVDRYANQPAATTPPVSSLPAFSPLASSPPAGNSSTDAGGAATSPITSIDPTAPAAGTGRYDRYDRYEAPAVASAPSATVPLPSTGTTALPPTTAPVQPAANVAQVTLPATPGGYRPGGTSTYNGSGATNVATRPANAESATGYPRYEDPAMPAAPSSYGTPDRYR